MTPHRFVGGAVAVATALLLSATLAAGAAGVAGQSVSFGVNGDYEFPLSSTVTAFVGGSLRYTGNQRAEFRIDPATASVDPDGNLIADALPQRKIGDYATIDLRAGAEFGQFTLEAYVRNLTDARGITSLNDADNLPFGAINAAYIQPRTIGLSLSAGF